jgi:hypothetical protein
LTYNTHGIAQRPLRSYSYKNQSIMAVAHRLLRGVPADGEAVLSRRAKAGLGGPRARKGPAPDPATDLLSFLKPHHDPADAARPAEPGVGIGPSSGSGPGASPGNTGEGATAAESLRRWDEELKGAEPALRAAWKVNVLDLDFQAVTAITLAAMLGLCLFVAAVMPPRPERTRATDALEFALVTLLTLVFSPLSFNYAYVWLLYPTTLGLHRVLNDPADPQAPRHRVKVGWIAAVLLIPALAIPMPQVAQACGNLFVPAVLLIFGLGAMLRASGRRHYVQPEAPQPHRWHRDDCASQIEQAASGSW